MSLKHVWIVFSKEIKDMARDKRTLISNILIPIILMPLVFTLMGGGISKMEKDIVENVTVALSQASDTPEIRDLVADIFSDNPNIKILDPVADPVEAVRNDRIRFVLDVEKDFAEKMNQGKPFHITVTFDQTDTKSGGSYGIITNAIEQYAQKVTEDRLTKMNIDVSILRPIEILNEDASPEKGGGNLMLMMILPMLATILIAVGGIPAATDLVAGEKERGTFEPLLTTQANRMSILFGKYLAVTLFAIICVVAQLIGVFIGNIVSPTFLTMGVPGADLKFHIPTLALLLTILITVTLGMVFAGLQLAVSTYARSFKEAQTYMSFLMLIAMLPAYATMMMQPDDVKLFMFFIPLLNAIASLKLVLGNTINYSYLGIALVSSLVYVFISLILAASMFKKEKVLFRS
jgi:sodium transport system permease protein